MFYTYLLVALIAVSFLKFYLYKRRMMKYVGHLPSGPELPIVGCGAYFFGKNSVEIMELLSMATDMMETPSRFWLGPILAINLAKPEDIQTVLLSPKCLEKPYLYKFMEVNSGLLSAPIHVWKPLRKLLNTSFNNKILLSFIPIFNEKSKVLVDILGTKVNEGAFDVLKPLLACTLDMVCATTVGVNFEFQYNKNIEVLDAMEGQSELVAHRMLRFWLHPNFIYKWTNAYKDFQVRKNCILEIPRKVRKLKEKEFVESKCFEKNHKLNGDEFFSTPQIFINELFKLYQGNLIDDQSMDDNLGYETSALALSNVILMLAMHPEIQEKAFETVKDAHQTQTSNTEADAFQELNYLEMCIKEALRLYPVAPFLARQNVDDIKLSNCIAPRGSLLLLSIYNLHRNKEIWGPNAERFDPDNFLPEKVASRHPFSFMPFSGGARNCIGFKYAWMSMKIILSAVLRKYKFSTHLRHEDIITKFEASLKIENRHLVKVERRQTY